MKTLPSTHLEQLAWNFAKQKHNGQVRKFTNVSYFDGHIAKVFGIVKQYSQDEDESICSLLHDSIEDTNTTFDEIKNIFGLKIANIVLELTNDSEKIKKFGKTNYLIYKMLTMSEKALTVKLSDRLQNISDAFTANKSFRLKYYNETIQICEAMHFRKMKRKHKLILQDIEHKLINIKSYFKYGNFKG